MYPCGVSVPWSTMSSVKPDVSPIPVGGTIHSGGIHNLDIWHCYYRDDVIKPTLNRGYTHTVKLGRTVSIPQSACPVTLTLTVRHEYIHWYAHGSNTIGGSSGSFVFNLRDVSTASISLDRNVINLVCSVSDSCSATSYVTVSGTGAPNSITWGQVEGVLYYINNSLQPYGGIINPLKDVPNKMIIILNGDAGVRTFSIPITATFV